MFYDDHVAAAEKEIGSRNFCKLVDTAVMLYEEEHRNLNGASTSSSLLDLNTIPFDSDPRNPLQLLSSPSSSSFLADDPETENPQNPPSSTSLVDYNTAAFEMATNPPNPNILSLCLAEKTSCKRLAVQERKRGAAASKEAKVAPEWLVRFVRDTEGAEGPVRLVFEKTLTETDVNRNQDRLLMPFKTLIRNDFLTPEESRTVALEDNSKNGVGVVLVDQRSVTWRLTLKRREMTRALNYSLMSGWNDMVEANGLKKDDDISVWSFRCRGHLCFALVTCPPPDMAQSSLSLALCL